MFTNNVEVNLQGTVFFRVIEAEKTVCTIEDSDQAIITAATSIMRSAGGKLELEDLQASRDSMTRETAFTLQKAAPIWGLEITRTEIIEVIVDEQTKASPRQPLNADQERRAVIAKAEGETRSVELAAGRSSIKPRGRPRPSGGQPKRKPTPGASGGCPDDAARGSDCQERPACRGV